MATTSRSEGENWVGFMGWRRERAGRHSKGPASRGGAAPVVHARWDSRPARRLAAGAVSPGSVRRVGTREPVRLPTELPWKYPLRPPSRTASPPRVGPDSTMAPSVSHSSIILPLPLDMLQSVSETLEQQGGAGETAIDAGPGANPGNQDPQAPRGLLEGAWPLLAIGAVIWFLIFAPERKARKKREEMLGALKKGDKVVTTGGLGQIADVRENENVIKCGEVRLTFSRSSVHQVQARKRAPETSDAARPRGRRDALCAGPAPGALAPGRPARRCLALAADRRGSGPVGEERRRAGSALVFASSGGTSGRPRRARPPGSQGADLVVIGSRPRSPASASESSPWWPAGCPGGRRWRAARGRRPAPQTNGTTGPRGSGRGPRPGRRAARRGDAMERCRARSRLARALNAAGAGPRSGPRAGGG